MMRSTTGICSIVAAVTFAGAALLAGAGQAQPAGEFVERIVALDPRWTVSFETAPTALAGFDETTAYVPVKGGELFAIDLDQGSLRWKVMLETAFTPATGDGLIFVASDRIVMALDQRTGQTQWRTPLENPIASPLYWEGGWLLASTEAGDLVALHGQDGRVVWRTSLQSPLVVSPTTSDERVYAALGDGRVVALNLESGTLEWTFALRQTVSGMLALDAQLLVGTRENLLHSLSLNRGRIRWSQRAGADVAGLPLADEQRIYFAAFDNLIRALDRDSGNLKWLRHLPSRPAGGPLRADNVVLVPLVTTDIGAFDAATGNPAFTIRAIGELGGVPFLRQTSRPTAPRLVVMSREGALQGFGARFEPPLAPLAELPGVAVKGGH